MPVGISSFTTKQPCGKALGYVNLIAALIQGARLTQG